MQWADLDGDADVTSGELKSLEQSLMAVWTENCDASESFGWAELVQEANELASENESTDKTQREGDERREKLVQVLGDDEESSGEEQSEGESEAEKTDGSDEDESEADKSDGSDKDESGDEEKESSEDSGDDESEDSGEDEDNGSDGTGEDEEDKTDDEKAEE